MCFLSSRAFSYLALSDMPFQLELGASQTLLLSPLIESFHLASHVTVFLCTTSPHSCLIPSPRSGTGGTFAFFDMFNVMSSGMMRACVQPGHARKSQQQPASPQRRRPRQSRTRTHGP